MILAMRTWTVPLAILGLSLGGCSIFSSSAPAPPYAAAPPSQPVPAPGSAAAPGPGETPYTPSQRTFRLSRASRALVSQARHQSAAGDNPQAAATLERALRIEPDNPLVWIELGRVRLAEKDAAQADALGRKALALATGDARAQGASWQLIADSLRLRGRNAEAADAEHRAQGFSTH
jgi:tetratricopeptide (TPR) repeat protein